MTSTFLLNWIAMIPDFAAPLILASIGLIICERSGIINLGAEGLMGIGAMSAVFVSYYTANPSLAIVAGVISALFLSIVFGIAVVLFKANQVLSGLAIVALGSGITGVVGRAVAHKPVAGFDKLDFGVISEIPWIGKIFFTQNILIYVIVIIVLLTWWVLMKTRIGLHLRAVGEDPATADVSGINVPLTRLIAVGFSGMFCGLAGAYLSIASSQVWVEGMISGRGWVSVALVIFARWRPLRAVAGALLFAAADALVPRLQAIGADIPVYLMMMLPYLLTLTVLIGPALFRKGSSAAPSSLGLDYLRQDRH